MATSSCCCTSSYVCEPQEIQSIEEFRDMFGYGRSRYIAGDRFGMLTAKRAMPGNPGIVWVCICDCGKEKNVKAKILLSGDCSSCGCIYMDRITRMGRMSKKHGMCKSREYKLWRSIKDRCYNPNSTVYKYYGGRGITMFSEWINNFEAFYEYIGERPKSKTLTLDRIDVNGNYEPGNLRWVDITGQANNRSNNLIIELYGKAQSLADWCREFNAKYYLVQSRIKRGWKPERALTT